MNNNKTSVYLSLFLLLAGILTVAASRAGDGRWDRAGEVHHGSRDITVYRDPSCGCCSKWIEHLKQHDFNVSDRTVRNLGAVKQRYGVPRNMASCHTAIIDDYVIEGHVPADDIKRLIRDKPDSAGLAVPRMPVGTPGMEMGGRRDAFAVYEFSRDGETRVYRSYPGR